MFEFIDNNFNNAVNNTKQFYDKLTNDPDDFPKMFKQMLNKIGDEQISSITIFRKPLQKVLINLFNILSLGEIQKRLNRSPYDDLFHLGLIINNKYILEKIQVVNLIKYNNSYLNSDGVEYMQLSTVPNISIRDFIMNSYNSVGKQFFLYNAMTNNCQIFVKNLLQYNNLYTSEINNFVLQEVQSIFKNNTFLKKLMNTVTDIGNRGTYAFGGGIDKKHSKLTTTSNNDLYLIANLLNIKLKILMSDEVYNYIDNDFLDGYYILNLEDSHLNGSHWTALFKKGDILYYNDSYGVYPDQSVYDLIKKFNYKLIMNNRQHQELGTESCGYWAIYFLYWMKHKPSKINYINRFTDFNKLFSSDTKKNEILLYNKIIELLKK